MIETKGLGYFYTPPPSIDASPHVRVAGMSPLPAQAVSAVSYSAASDITAPRPAAVYLLPFARVP